MISFLGTAIVVLVLIAFVALQEMHYQFGWYALKDGRAWTVRLRATDSWRKSLTRPYGSP